MLDRSPQTYRTRAVLLLQGPVGPFFNELKVKLFEAGYSVKHILFNAGDSVFATGQSCFRFTGTVEQWETWLRFELSQNKPDSIILFGSNRPAHKIARRLADAFGISVLALEEGYLRAGYVTAELGGNNEYSALTAWNSFSHQVPLKRVPHDSTPMKSSFATMSFFGTIYYLARDLLSSCIDEKLFHRPRERVLPLSWSWCTHILQRAVTRLTEAPLRRALKLNQGYIIVPLQVASDSQIQQAARDWTTPLLIDGCLKALAQSHQHQTVLFKLHPLERGSRKIKQMIRQRARELKISSARYDIIQTGKIGELAARSSGMVLINSTSAFSALHHGVPLLVLGNAIFRHNAIATLADTPNDIAEFFKTRVVKSPAAVADFFQTVKSQSLLPGDFYQAAGRKEAISNIIKKLDELQIASPIAREVTT